MESNCQLAGVPEGGNLSTRRAESRILPMTHFSLFPFFPQSIVSQTRFAC